MRESYSTNIGDIVSKINPFGKQSGHKEHWSPGDPPVTFYKDANYATMPVSLQYGSYPNLSTAGGYLKAMSSIEIAPFTEVTLYDSLNLTGNTLLLEGPTSVPNLSSYGFNDKAQSMTIVFVPPPLATQAQCCWGSTTDTCGNYIPGSSTCNTSLLGYCAANMSTDPQCKTWCSANPGQCDAIMPAYCAAHPSDPYCSCLLSPVLSNPTTKSINPKCVDSKCLLSGYLNSNMQGTACPSIITCDMQVALTNSGVQLGTYVPIEQNCGGNVTTATPAENTSTTIANTANGTGSTAGQPSTATVTSVPIAAPAASSTLVSYETYIVMFFILLLFVVLMWMGWSMLGDDTVPEAIKR